MKVRSWRFAITLAVGALSWKVIQVYEDGSKSEWTGPQGSRTPAPSVELKKPAANSVK